MKRFLGETTGERVRLLRNDLGLTQTQVREMAQQRLGTRIAGGYISEIENGRKQPGAAILAALAQVLQTSTDYLLCLTDDYREAGEREQIYYSEEADRIARMVDMLDSVRRDEVVIVVSALLAAQRRDRIDYDRQQLQNIERALREKLSPEIADSILDSVRREFEGGVSANHSSAK